MGNLYEGSPDIIRGMDNTFDTINIVNTPCKFIGKNTVTGLIRFGCESLLSSKGNNKNIINHAVFSSNGHIEGSNDFNILTLGTGFHYRLQHDSISHPGSYYTNKIIQTVNQLEVSGNCNVGVTMLSSDYSPIQAVINYTGGLLSTEYLQVRDIKNTGTTMNVVEGINAGNNEGIEFINSLQPRILYWVNGQGLWSDSNHWSLESGGNGGECPPTRLDDIFFNSGSGFTNSEDTVLVQSPHVHCHDMIWVDGLSTSLVHFASADTTKEWFFIDSLQTWTLKTHIEVIDTCALHISGSVELDLQLDVGFAGDVYYESENNDEFEILNLEWFGPRYNFKNKTIFDGEGGKWKLADGTKFFNPVDSVIFRQGELLLDNDTMEVYNFIAVDTLPRKISLLDNTLVVLHQWNADAWNINASMGINGNTLLEFDAGKSTIRSLGDYNNYTSLEGQCNIKTSGSSLIYNNIEFGFESVTNGAYSALISESSSKYNRVEFFYQKCYASGTGTIDTLLWHPTSNNSFILDNHNINVLMAYGQNDAIYGTQQIDTALFFGDAIISGNQNIGFLLTEKTLILDSLNTIDTAVMLGNTRLSGKNIFSQLTLGPNSRYIFENIDSPKSDTTMIIDDWIMEGTCDGPIRLQSDLPGTQAEIIYKAQNPSNPDYTANYVSIQDIKMFPWNNNQYLAMNAVDLGNNENWVFDQTGGDTYYWIGGSGNWSDWQHWSKSSGGLPIMDKCIPREINSVVFDNNSFTGTHDTVYVNVSIAYCNNMWWKFDTILYNPIFQSSDSTLLFIYGSLMLKETLLFDFNGEIYFDQFIETANLPDTIYSKGLTFLNNVYFQGKDDVIILDDPMRLSVINKCILFHHYGTLNLNGNEISTGGFYSNKEFERTLNLNNSTLSVNYSANRALWLEGNNLLLNSNNSTIINNSTGGSIVLLNGSTFSFDKIIVNGGGDSLYNQNNETFYGKVDILGNASLISGSFTADSIFLRGYKSGIYKKGDIKVLIVDGLNGSINNSQTIDQCFFNKAGKVNGNNQIKYCVFLDDGTFLGQNVFDTLVLYPGEADEGGLGNWYYFQIDSTQTIHDSLYMRGNQCSNMNISTTPPNSPVPAFIRKDNGFDIAADYLNIYNVGAYSGGDVKFYAGANSTPLPDPNNPPPGWIFENAQGYIPGFNGKTESFCTGEEYAIDASAFNGGPSTQYFWNGIPGEVIYPVSEPGKYYINVVYNENCDVNDSIIIEEFAPPIATIPEGPYCENYPIVVEVTPSGDDYSYVWWNGEQIAAIEAQLDYTGTVSVVVNDMSTSCIDTAFLEIVVKPTPDPESVLGSDTTIKFEETITLDAGEGDFYDWTSEPFQPIDNPDQRYITVPGYVEPVEYIVWVELDGCGAEGTKVISMYPPSRIGIPTAFSPNGDGLNDVLFVRGSGFTEIEFKVFNRFGQLVFETNDPAEGWDGKFEGIDQPVEVYTWLIKASFADQTFIEDAGNVTLLR
ncbi:MAG TPA: gliding motility-associated C-terminal domain-containing protein [Bacteroidales bacterium]|nr:gliding motility-associated C-terminal domain-containing protein [Bacteroidales bacterium]